MQTSKFSEFSLKRSIISTASVLLLSVAALAGHTVTNADKLLANRADMQSAIIQVNDYLLQEQPERVDSLVSSYLGMIALKGDENLLCNAYATYFKLLPVEGANAIAKASNYLSLAKSLNSDYHIALSSSALSRLETKSLQSLDYAKDAFIAASRYNKSSELKIDMLVKLADAEKIVGDRLQILEACRNYLKAAHLADSIGDEKLLAICYEHLADFYYDLDDYENATDYRNLQLHTLGERITEQELSEIQAAQARYYILWGKAAEAEILLQQILQHSESISDKPLRRDIFQMYRALYLDNNQLGKLDTLYTYRYPDELPTVQQEDRGLYYRILALISFQRKDLGKSKMYFDSAEYYLPALKDVRAKFYGRYAELLLRFGDTTACIQRLRIAYLNTEYPPFVATIAQRLADIYDAVHREDSAYYFQRVASFTTDKWRQLTDEKDLVKYQIMAEEDKDRLIEAREEQLAHERLNIQYTSMLIGFVMCVFVLMYVTSIKLSKRMAGAIAFVTFLMLFELINMVIHHKIDKYSSGIEDRPLLYIAIKLIIAGCVLLIHHRTEERVLHFFTRHRILRVNKPSWMILRQHNQLKVTKRNRPKSTSKPPQKSDGA